MTELSVEPVGAELTDEQRDDLQLGLSCISDKADDIERNWAYYDGEHPSLWITEKLKRIFHAEDLYERLGVTNYCGIVVDKPLHRMRITGFKVEDEQTRAAREAANRQAETTEQAQARQPRVDQQPGEQAAPDDQRVMQQVEEDPRAAQAEEVWKANRLHLEQIELYRHTLVAGEGFVIVWPNEPELVETGSDAPDVPEVMEEDPETPFEIIVQEPRQIHVEYASRRPGDVKFAVKAWPDPDQEVFYANLYYPDQVINLVAANDPRVDDKDSRDVSIPSAEVFRVIEVGPNPFAPRVPVVPFRLGRTRRSRLTSVKPIQDRINILEADKALGGKFSAYRQSVILTKQIISAHDMQLAPDEVMVLDPGEGGPEGWKAAVEQLDAVELANIDSGINEEITRLMTVSSMPRHMMVNPGTAPSGDAIKADEGPFVALIKDYTEQFNAAWQDVYELMDMPDLEPVWTDPETEIMSMQAVTLKALVDAGVPLGMAMQMCMGLSDEEIQDMRAMEAQERRASVTHTAALSKAQDQGRDLDED